MVRVEDVKILSDCRNIMKTLPKLSKDGLKFLYKIVDHMTYEERKGGLPRKLLDYRSSGKDSRFYQMDITKISSDLIGRENGPIRSLLDKDYKCFATTDDGELYSIERKNDFYITTGKDKKSLNYNEYCSKKFLYDLRDWIKNDMIPKSFLINGKEEKFDRIKISYMKHPISDFLDIIETTRENNRQSPPYASLPYASILINVQPDNGKIYINNLLIGGLNKEDEKIALEIKSINDVDKIFFIIEKMRAQYLNYINGKKLVFNGDSKSGRDYNMFEFYQELNSISIEFIQDRAFTVMDLFVIPNFVFSKRIDSSKSQRIRRFFDDRIWEVNSGTELSFHRYKQIFSDSDDEEMVKATKDLDKKIKKIIEKYDQLDKHKDKKYSLYRIENILKKEQKLYQLILSKVEPPLNDLWIVMNWKIEAKLVGDDKGNKNKNVDLKLLIKDMKIDTDKTTGPTSDLMYIKADVNPEENLKKFKSSMEIIDRDEWLKLYNRKTKKSKNPPDEWFYHIDKYEILEKLTPELLKKMGIKVINKLYKNVDLILIRKAKIDIYDLHLLYNNQDIHSTYKNFIWEI